jgi:hypothetical protein
MRKKTLGNAINLSLLLFVFLSCSAFPAGRSEEPSEKQEVRMYWVIDGSMSEESAEMFLERYLLPTSLAAMLWTEFSTEGEEVRFNTRGGYRVVRKTQALSESLGVHTVYGYDLMIDVTLSPPAPRRSPDSYSVRFSYSESTVRGSGVIPQPLEQALLTAIRESGRPSGMARVKDIDYLGSGKFKATVLIGD